MPAKRRIRNPPPRCPTRPGYLGGQRPQRSSLRIVGSNRIFFLREPIDLDVHRDNGHFVIEYAPLNLPVYGDTEEEAFSAFADIFETA